MATCREALWHVLQDLTNEQFKQFKWFLKEDNVHDGFTAIAVARLEGADRQDTVDQMVQQYGCNGAFHVTIKNLEKINRNDLVQRMRNMSSFLGNKNSVAHPCDNERSAKVRETKAQIELLIKERQMKICEIERSAKLSKKSAERQIAASVGVVAVLLQSVQSSLDKLIEEIEEKQKKTEKQAERLVQQLEQEISKLTTRRAEVEQLSLTNDSCNLLQGLPSTNESLTDVGVPQPSYRENVITTVDLLKEKLSKEMETFLSDAQLNRLQQFAVDVTLDPDTAHPNLLIYDDGRQVCCGNVQPNLLDNPERFDSAINVVGKQCFYSRSFYYEVEVTGKTAWDVGVVKESISRKGSIKASPENGFWTICLREGSKYKASAVNLSVKRQPRKVGVFVDYEKRSVSFYNAESAELIHCYTDCSLTEKLYPFFSPGVLHGGQNSAPLIISAVGYVD